MRFAFAHCLTLTPSKEGSVLGEEQLDEAAVHGFKTLIVISVACPCSFWFHGRV